MKRNILEYLEDSVKEYPDRCAYKDKSGAYTFAEVYRMARVMGSRLGKQRKPENEEELKTEGSLGNEESPKKQRQIEGQRKQGEAKDQKKPVAVMMEKSVSAIISFLGVVYAGRSYCPIDITLPQERIKALLAELDPDVIVAGKGQEGLVRSMDLSGKTSWFEELIRGEEDSAFLEAVRRASVDMDALYLFFTSGSTGTPKGAVISHRTMIDTMEWLDEEFAFGPEDVMGNQAPLSFNIANQDIYCPLKFGCSMVIIPTEYFAFPGKLIPFLQEERITSIFWAPFALCVAANLKALEICALTDLRYVFFAGEPMPVKQLNYWREHVPGAQFINMYGSTETYGTLFYRVEREFQEGETLPIGGPCRNISAFVLDENDREITPQSREKGELCVRSSGALGYYCRREESGRSFVQNPLNPYYRDMICRTGDLVSYNEYGELLYHGRIDLQIKHLGYRIELGEIEAAAETLAEVEVCACRYDAEKQRILCFYSGKEVERKVLAQHLGKKLPRYMLPGKYIYLEEMPRNKNGKIDRKNLPME